MSCAPLYLSYGRVPTGPSDHASRGAQVVYQSIGRDNIVALLREHLRANLLKLGRDWHYQRRGIPQVRLWAPAVCPASVAHPCAGAVQL